MLKVSKKAKDKIMYKAVRKQRKEWHGGGGGGGVGHCAFRKM